MHNFLSILIPVNERGAIESVDDILKSVCDIEPTRHRKPEKAKAQIATAVIACQTFDKKPHVFIPNVINYLSAA